MGLKIIGAESFDPETGMPTEPEPPWGDTDIPGKFQGGGKGFGPGGFPDNPRMVAPASGSPPGVSLSGNSAAPTNAFGMKPHIDPTTGQPEMLTGPGGIAEKTRGSMNPFGFIGRGNPYWRGAIAAGGVLTPTPAETGEFNPAMITGRPDAPMSGVHGLPAPRDSAAPPMMPPPTSTPATAYPAARAPMPRRRPVAAPVAAPVPAQSPWITTDYRQNRDMAGGARGQGQTQQGMLDLSKLFGRR